MIRALAWAVSLPWEVLALAAIAACSFWTAVVARRLRRRTDLQRWQAFQTAMREQS